MYLAIVDLGEGKILRFFDNYADAQLFLIEWGSYPAMICYVNHIVRDDEHLSQRIGWGES